MRDIANRFRDDNELSKSIGKDAISLLRWILLSNRSQIISVPPGRNLVSGNCGHQFMTLLSSPEAEERFSALRAKYGSCYLWHGSHSDRWHAILRTCLKNATGSGMQANGAALGPGIYLARSSATSWQYSRPATNKYRNSEIGSNLHMIALCEVANIPSRETSAVVTFTGRNGVTTETTSGFLKDHGWAHTLTMESACVVRFLFVGGQFSHDTLTTPPSGIPTLKEMLEAQARRQ